MNMTLYAGIDIGATNIKYGLVDGTGNIAWRNQTPTPKRVPAEKLFEAIVQCGENLLIEADEQNATIAYIGVGSPGSISLKTGLVQGTCPNIPGWEGFHLRDRLSERLNLPVIADNDANCAALAEHRFGAGQGYDNIICLTVGTGIGGGLILGGRLYHGGGYSAGEIGHMLVSPINGDSVQYLETVVSSPAIVARVRARLEQAMTPAFRELIGQGSDQLTIRKIFLAIRKGDRMALEEIRAAGKILASALISLVNVLNPELVILGGGVAEGGSEFVDTVRGEIMTRALPSARDGLRVVPAKLGNAAGFIGAAHLGTAENE